MMIINEGYTLIVNRRYIYSFYLQEFLIAIVLQNKSANLLEIKLILSVPTLLF